MSLCYAISYVRAGTYMFGKLISYLILKSCIFIMEWLENVEKS